MFKTSADSPKLKKKDNKLSRLITREVSMSNFSKEDNYHGGVSVSIPFRWESEPGTPKIRFREKPLPPLTPPPSYYYNSPKSSIKKHPKSNLLGNIFPKRVTRKSQLPPSPASSSSSSSSSSSASFSRSPWSTSYSVPSSPIRPANFRGRYGRSSPRFSFDSRVVLGVEEEEYESHASTLCFADRVANARSRTGCYSSLIKVLLRDSQ